MLFVSPVFDNSYLAFAKEIILMPLVEKSENSIKLFFEIRKENVVSAFILKTYLILSV